MSGQFPPLTTGRRRHRTLDEARALSAAWRSSGMSKEGWCREQGLLRSSLESCLTRVMQAEAAERSGPVGFMAVEPPPGRSSPSSPGPGVVEDGDPAPGLTVMIGDRLRVTGLDLSGVVDLARRLGVVAG